MVEKDIEVWETSVGNLLTIFREALISLTPYLGKAHIGLKEGDQYDDYDAITEILFETIVINSIKWSFVEPQEVECPAYGFKFDPERHTSFVEVRLNTKPNQERPYIFHTFSSQDNLFDTVECYPFDSVQDPLSSEIVNVPIYQCSFQLRFKEESKFNAKSSLSVLL